jgi:hypothetical protein
LPSLSLVETGAADVHVDYPAVRKLQFMLDLIVKDDVLTGDAGAVLAVTDPSLGVILTRQATGVQLRDDGLSEGRRFLHRPSPVPRARWFMPVTGGLDAPLASTLKAEVAAMGRYHPSSRHAIRRSV